jgi:hypothetical protein
MSCTLEAVKQSYTIQHIILRSRPHPNVYSSWDAVSVTAINVICRFNRSGRRYMKVDLSNQSEGLKVLEAVKDDLDCLYFHLRENPMLCEQPVDLSPIESGP